MKKFLLSAFIFTGIAVYSDTCNAGFYKIEGNKVYYAYDMNPNPDLVELGKQAEVKGADAKTFNNKADYGKDIKNIYFEGKIVKGVDTKTFEVLSNEKEVKNSGHRAVCYYYAKDKKSVYYKGQIINGADVKTFKVLENLYAEDKNSWYEYGEKINN